MKSLPGHERFQPSPLEDAEAGCWYVYEMTEGGHLKFWAVKYQATSMRVRFGRLGTEGQERYSQPKWPAEQARKKIQEKLAKGYHLAYALRPTLVASFDASEEQPREKPATVVVQSDTRFSIEL